MLARPAPVSSVPGRGGPGAASVSAVARAGADSEHQASVSAGLTPAPVTHRPAPRISSYANITTQSQSIRQNVNQHHHSFKHLSELSHKLIVSNNSETKSSEIRMLRTGWNSGNNVI